MQWSELEVVWKVIHGPETIETILSGKSYARDVSGHLFVQRALNHLLLTSLLSSHSDIAREQPPVVVTQTGATVAEVLDDETLLQLTDLYNQVWNGRVLQTLMMFVLLSSLYGMKSSSSSTPPLYSTLNPPQ